MCYTVLTPHTAADGGRQMVSMQLWGRIDELEDIDTVAKMEANLLECHADDTEPPNYLEAYKRMYDVLDLMPGTYMVTGIEGLFYDGYVSGKRLVSVDESTPAAAPPATGDWTVTVPNAKWVDDPDNDRPWPLEVPAGATMFDIMQLVAASDANGYPDINHVWFEAVDVDVLKQTLHFHMGS